jgi:hypothetical protein
MMGNHTYSARTPKPDQNVASPGSHDKPELTGMVKMPGTGFLPEAGQPVVEAPTD